MVAAASWTGRTLASWSTRSTRFAGWTSVAVFALAAAGAFVSGFAVLTGRTRRAFGSFLSGRAGWTRRAFDWIDGTDIAVWSFGARVAWATGWSLSADLTALASFAVGRCASGRTLWAGWAFGTSSTGWTRWTWWANLALKPKAFRHRTRDTVGGTYWWSRRRSVSAARLAHSSVFAIPTIFTVVAVLSWCTFVARWTSGSSGSLLARTA